MTAADFVCKLGANARAVKIASGWQCRCPAHDDRKASLTVSQSGDKVLIHCHAGCKPQDICAAAGVKLADLFSDKSPRTGQAKRIVATYDYRDEEGTLLFQVCRFEPKDFSQRKPDLTAKDGWTWKTRGARRVPFHLPELVAAVAEERRVFVVEGEKDVLAVVDAGFAATCNPGGASKWQRSFDVCFKGADVCIIADKDPAGRSHAQTVAASLYSVADCVRVVELPDVNGKPVKDAADFFAAGGQAHEFDQLTDRAPLWNQHPAPEPQESSRSRAYDLQRAIADPRPKIRLPGCDRLLSDFASELVQVLRYQDIFYRNGEIVTLIDGDLKLLTPQTFRCWSEKFFIGYRAKTIGENSFQFDVTMTDNEARGTLAAPQFTDALRRVRRVNRARLPIIGEDGKLTLLPNGYHAETETLTLASVDYGLDMPLNAAVGAIDDLLVEFHFADGERSKAVSVAAMVGLFANQLLPEKSLRPCFIFVANAEGAGKSTLARICIAPTLGAMPTGCKSNEDEEIRKFLLTAIREGCLVIFFDNFKGKLSSPALESFLSAPVWSDRKLGVSETVTGDNLATCFVTGNGMTVSPDIRRRSLFMELHLEAERAEDKKFMRDLEFPQILEMRPKILAALWAMVRHWDQQGRPAPSRGHSAFPSWANIIGGIVETAGFACPLQTANVTASADPDGEDIRRLVSEMAHRAAPCTFAEVIELAREHGLFESVIGPDGEELGRREKSAFSKLLGRYDRRQVLNYRFIADGKGKTRLYKVEVGNGGHGGNGVPGEKTLPHASELERRDHADHANHSRANPL